jgi:hypothetical protein
LGEQAKTPRTFPLRPHFYQRGLMFFGADGQMIFGNPLAQDPIPAV